MKLQFLTVCLLMSAHIYAQQTTELTLKDVMERAGKKSLDAVLNENQKLVSYWDYQSFKVEYLPVVSLELKPFSYNKQVVQRYNSQLNRDEFKSQKTLNTYGGLSVEQQLPFTGGTLYFESDLARLKGYGSNEYTSFSSTFARIGINQSIFGYNSYKWRNKIEPLRYLKAQKTYVFAQQEINVRSVSLFFNLVAADQSYKIALNNLENIKVLYQIGEKRLQIAGIEKADLLQLELNKVNAEVEIEQRRKDYNLALFALSNYLGNDLNSVKILLDETALPDLKIDLALAWGYVKSNNPDLSGFQQKLLEAEQRLAQLKGTQGFKAGVSLSLGFDQQASQFHQLYQLTPLGQQRVDFTLSIPLINWGRQYRGIQKVKKDIEVTKASVKQDEMELEQRLRNLVENFNLQSRVVDGARKADAIAYQSYTLINERFKLGKTDIINLNAAAVARQNAKQTYITGIRNYWDYYYSLQKLTGYDFINGRSL